MTSPPQPPGRRTTDPPLPGRILVVDDSRTVRRILRRALEDAGYEVDECGDGEQALASCRARRPDLVLLDVDMPVMDGLATMRALKEDPELASLPVLFLTARTGGTDVATGLGLGAQDYLRKPCEPAELTARVANALRLKAQELALQRQAMAMDTLSSTDPLTGLGNRRLLETRIGDAALLLGVDAVVSVLIADLDHFKQVNDTRGHVVGDRVLRVAAARMREAAPPGATLVRWGGEEFLLLVPGATLSDAAAAGERLRAAVSGEPFSVGCDRTLVVTVSVGVAAGPAGDIATTIAVADEALYEAKSSGRDRVCGPRGTPTT